MNLYLIENDQTIDSLIGSEAYVPQRDVIICFNYLVYIKMKEERTAHNFLFVEDLLTAKDYEELHAYSDRFALNWYKNRGIDLTLFNGISFGWILKFDFSRRYLLSILLKYGEVINKAVRKWPAAEKIFYDFSNQYNSFYMWVDDGGKFFNKQGLVEKVSGQLGRGCFLLKPGSFIPSVYEFYQSRNPGRNIRQKIKSAVENTLSKISLMMLWSIREKKEIYFFSQGNIESFLNGNSKHVISDSPCIAKPSDFKKFLDYTYCKFENIPYRLNRDETAFLSVLRERLSNNKLIGESDADFVFRGIDYTNIYTPAIADLVLNVIPSLVRYAAKIRKAIKRFNLHKVIVNEELDEKYRVAIEVCRAEGLESVLLLHGIQTNQHAQATSERSGADIVICPGTFFAEYYLKEGSSSRRCIALGNPSLDSYLENKARKVTSIKDVLFLTFEDTFYSRLDRFVYQEKYYNEIFPIFDDLSRMGIRIHFKPHPHANKRYYQYLFRFFRVDITKINYIEKSPFANVIYDMDLVVSNLTTCFYEAQAAGVPTIFFEPNFIPGSLLPPLNGINGEEVIRISTGKELLAVIKANQNNPDGLVKFHSNFLQKYGPRYMGKLDGMAGKRIAAFMLT